MLWLTWQMWILLALALLGGGIVGWMARGRSDEAEPAAQPAKDRTASAATPASSAKKPEARPQTEADAKTGPTKTAPAGKVAAPDHAQAEAGGADKAADPVAVGPTAPVAPDKGSKKAGSKPAPKRPAKPAAKPGSAAAKPAPADSDITRIKGLGPRAAEKLNEAGVTRLSHIAAWNDEDIDRYDAMIAGRGRIRRDDWVGQAKALTS